MPRSIWTSVGQRRRNALFRVGGPRVHRWDRRELSLKPPVHVRGGQRDPRLVEIHAVHRGRHGGAYDHMAHFPPTALRSAAAETRRQLFRRSGFRGRHRAFVLGHLSVECSVCLWEKGKRR